MSVSKVDLQFLGRGRRATQISDQERTPYATSADFCRIFMNDMDSLYLLSLLLTGEHSVAEHCFIHSLEESQKGNPVFKQWTQSWAKRKIIQNAIHVIRSRSTDNWKTSCTSGLSTSRAMAHPAEITNILDLPQFERFVFVMFVLERFSLQDCALLLGCSRSEVVAARTRAIQHIAKTGKLPCKVVSVDSDD